MEIDDALISGKSDIAGAVDSIKVNAATDTTPSRDTSPLKPTEIKLRPGIKFLYTHLNSPTDETKTLLDSWQCDKLVETLVFSERKLVLFYSALVAGTQRMPAHKRKLNEFNVSVLEE